MKKIFALAAVFCLTATSGFSAQRVEDVNNPGINVDPNCEYQTGSCVCYCKMVKYEPQEYCTTRCEKEPYTVERKCCRKVPEYYTKKHCRYVPEYYETTHCRYRNEYYCVPETKYRTKLVKETHCRYVPRCYVKKVCTNVDACAPTCAPACDPCNGR